jgi:hypothetical protein
VSLTKLYVISNNGSYSRLHVVENTGSWNATSTNWYYKQAVTSFDAVTLPDDSRDVLLFTTRGADRYDIWEDSEDAGTTWGWMQGVWGMFIKSDRPSYMFEVDVADAYISADGYLYIGSDKSDGIAEWKGRTEHENVKVTNVNGTLFAVYHTWANGHKELSFCTSKSGEFWSVRESFNLAAWEGGGVIDALSTVSMIVEQTGIYITDGIALTGNSSTAVETDITADIETATVNMSAVRQLTAYLNNKDYDYDYLIDSTDRWEIVEEMGYVVSGTTYKIQTAIYEVDIINWSPMQQQIQVIARDRSTRLKEKVNPPENELRESQWIHASTYMPLAFVVGVTGTWAYAAEYDGPPSLCLLTDDTVGYAYIAGNGQVSDFDGMFVFNLASGGTPSSEKAGMVFHTDTAMENYLTAYYDQDTDQLHVGRCVSSSLSSLANSSTLSWAKDTWYAVRVEVRGLVIKVYYSTVSGSWDLDWLNFDWTLAITYYNTTPNAAVPMEGPVGLIARGYSDGEDEGTRFKSVMVAEAKPYVSVETTARCLAELAGIHDINVRDYPIEWGEEHPTLSDASSYSWTESTKTLTVTGGGSGMYQYVPVTEFSHDNFEITFTSSATVGAVGFFGGYDEGNSSGRDFVQFYWSGSLVELRRHSSSFYCQLDKTTSGSRDFRIQVKRFQDETDYVLSAWINGEMVLAHPFNHGDKGAPPPSSSESPYDNLDHMFVAFYALDSNTNTYSNVRIAELFQPVEAITADPDQPLLSTLARAASRRDIELFSRYDGSLTVRRYSPYVESSHDYFEQDIDNITYSRDTRGLIAHFRKTGAYDIADIYDEDMYVSRGHRLASDKNPFIMDRTDALGEARRSITSARRLSKSATLDGPFNVALETGDRVDTYLRNGAVDQWNIDDHQVALVDGAWMHSARLRRYSFDWLIRDRFTVDLGGSEDVAYTSAVPGPGLRIADVDTGSNLYIEDGRLYMEDQASGDPSLWYAPIARFTGITALFEIMQSVGGNFFLGLDSNMTGGAGGIGVQTSGGSLELSDNGSTEVDVYELTVDTFYQIAVNARAAGFFVFLKGGSLEEWTLMGMADTDTTSTLYATVQDTTAHIGVYKLSVPNVAFFPGPVASDSFTRSNANYLGRTDGAGLPEYGGGNQLWSAPTWAISSNLAVNSSPYSPALVRGPCSDVLVSVTLTATVAADTGIVMNASSLIDPDHYVTCYKDSSGYIKLDYYISGSPTSVFTSSGTYTSAGRLSVRKIGTSYRIFYGTATVTPSDETISNSNIINNTINGLWAEGTDGLADFSVLPTGSSNGEYRIMDELF